MVLVALAGLLVPLSAGGAEPVGTIVVHPAGIHGPDGLVLGPDGNLWVANRTGSSISRVTPAGAVTTFHDPTIDGPRRITAGPDGNLWFTNTSGDSIGRITPEGVITDFADPEIDEPWGITSGPDGNVWFANRGDDSIGRLTPDGTLTTFTDPSIIGPVGIVAGPDGDLWFANSTGGSIGQITTEGDVTEHTGGGITSPRWIVAGPDDDLWFTIDVGDATSFGRITTAGAVSVFGGPIDTGLATDLALGSDGVLRAPTLDTMLMLSTEGGPVTSDPDLGGLQGVAPGPDGLVWGSVFFANRIVQTDGGQLSNVALDISGPDQITLGADGNLWFSNERSMGRITPTGEKTFFDDPALAQVFDVTTGPDGNVWFTTLNGHSVGYITPAGAVTTFTDPTIRRPWGITAGPDGNLWFTNEQVFSESIGRITPAGEVTAFTDPSIDDPRHITAGPDGNLWFTNREGDSIGTITTDGVVTDHADPSIDAPDGITAGADGNLWFTNGAGSSIGRITPAGVVTDFASPAIDGASDVALGPDGNVWFTNAQGSGVGRVTPDGTVTTFTEPILDRPEGVTAGPDGTVWFTDEGGDAIGSIVAVEEPGQLRVTTTPALPAEIIVDGVARDSWGLNWVDLAPGEHEVCFSEVPGYAAPPCHPITITSGAVTELVGEYTEQGFLQVVTDPALPSTITVDGVARDDWGVWTEMAPGTYDVCFGEVADFEPPACREVEVTAGATATTVGTFTPDTGAPGPPEPYGHLRAVTDPAVGAMISVDGLPRDNWGLDWLKLPVGTHEVCFGPTPQFTAPAACDEVSITEGATTTVTGAYQAQGFLRVLTDPSVPATITVDGAAANAFGVWTPKVPATYDVCFGPAPGFVAPACQFDVEVVAGETTTVTGTYVPS